MIPCSWANFAPSRIWRISSTASPTLSPRLIRSLSDAPSTYSIAIQCRSSASPRSKTPTMFGCWSPAAACASRRKRSTNCGVLAEPLMQELQRHPAPEHLVGGEPDVGHPAAAEAADEGVAVADPLPAPRAPSVGERLHHLGRDRARDLAAEAAGALLEHHRDRHLGSSTGRSR